MRVRNATTDDASAIAAIYNQGIEERIATFETSLRADDDVLAWFDGVHPIVVVTEDDDDAIIAFARSSEYSARECYRGIFEYAVYTDFAHRRRGAGLLAMRELVTQARAAGAWKLVSRIFVDNDPSRMLMAALGFREVGVHHRHAKLEGKWRDVVVVEKFLAPVGVDTSLPPPPPPVPRDPREQALVSLRGADIAVRGMGLESARAMLAAHKTADPDLLEAVADACFASPRHEPAVRARFVEVFRTYGSLSRDAARAVDAALFARLERLSVVLDLDGFYEAMFVVRQAAGGTSDPARAAELAIYRPRLLAWMREAIDLPRTLRGRISPGNFVSLVMALALAASETDAQKQEVAELAASGRDRHRIDPPATLRPPSRPPPSPMQPSPAPPAPSEAPPPPEPVAEEPPKKSKRKRAPADPNKPKRKSRAKPKLET